MSNIVNPRATSHCGFFGRLYYSFCSGRETETVREFWKFNDFLRKGLFIPELIREAAICSPLLAEVFQPPARGAGVTYSSLRQLQLPNLATAAPVHLVKMEVNLLVVRTSYSASCYGPEGIITWGTLLRCHDTYSGVSPHFRDNEDM